MKIKQTLAILPLLLITGTIFASAALGQDAAQAAPPPSESISILGLFKAGGWAMYPLLILSMATFGLVFYNFMVLRPKNFLKKEFLGEIEPLVVSRNVPQAREICAQNPSVIANIIDAGLERMEATPVDFQEVKDGIDEASTKELAKPFVIINFLSVIAALSPMVGLLGTVSGMIKAFRNIAAQGMGQPQVLADNISEALITTATGLIVAIPAMFFYFVLKNMYGSIAAQVSKVIGDIFYKSSRSS